MKAQYSMRQARQIMTRAPVNKPPAWVFTPLAQLTAVLQFFVFLFRSDLNQDHLENDPVVGMEEKNEPMMLQAPSAIISWLASKGFPPATRKGVFKAVRYHCEVLQKAFAMATDSRMAMIGMMMKALPRLLAMSPKETSSGGNVPFSTLCFGMEKGGRAGFGMPPAMSPVSVKVQLSLKNIFLCSI